MVDDAIRPPRQSALEPLKHSAFRMLAAGRFVSMAGNAIAPIALSFAVLDKTGSVASLGIVVGTRSLANVLFLLFGGVVADRFSRSTVLVVSSVLSAISQTAVATMVLTDTMSMFWLLTLSGINGATAAFAMPASSALVPQTVPEEHLQLANAVLRLGQNLALIGGASSAGVLIAFVGPGWGLAADATGFALSAVFFGMVRTPSDGRESATESSTSPLNDLRDGWYAFTERSWVWTVVVGFMILNGAFMAGVQVLGPAVADQTIGRGVWGVVMAGETVGMAAGALVALRIRLRRLLLFGVVCGGSEILLMLALALSPNVPSLIGAGLLAGLGVELFGVAWETSLQQHISANKLARVYSYDMLGSFAAIPLAELAVGPAAHVLGLRTTLLIAAALATTAVLGMVSVPTVRSLQNQPAGSATGESDGPLPASKNSDMPPNWSTSTHRAEGQVAEN